MFSLQADENLHLKNEKAQHKSLSTSNHMQFHFNRMRGEKPDLKKGKYKKKGNDQMQHSAFNFWVNGEIVHQISSRFMVLKPSFAPQSYFSLTTCSCKVSGN